MGNGRYANSAILGLSLVMFCTHASESPPKIYGTFNMTVEYVGVDIQGVDPAWSVESHGSHMGISGRDKMPSGAAIYKLEYQLNADGSSASALGQRDIYVGLENSFGRLRMGHMNTPLKTSQGMFDLFNDTVDIGQLLDGENRLPNQVNVTSKQWRGLEFSVSALMSESAGQDNGVSASLSFNHENLYIALAVDRDLPARETSTNRLTLIYQASPVRVGALFQQVAAGDVCDECSDIGYAFNLSYTYEHLTLKAQSGQSDQQNQEGRSTSIGLDYRLGPASFLYLFADRYKDKAELSGVDRAGAGIIHRF